MSLYHIRLTSKKEILAAQAEAELQAEKEDTKAIKRSVIIKKKSKKHGK